MIAIFAIFGVVMLVVLVIAVPVFISLIAGTALVSAVFKPSNSYKPTPTVDDSDDFFIHKYAYITNFPNREGERIEALRYYPADLEKGVDFYEVNHKWYKYDNKNDHWYFLNRSLAEFGDWELIK